jgi:hypothetical protein
MSFFVSPSVHPFQVHGAPEICPRTPLRLRTSDVNGTAKENDVKQYYFK